MFDFLRRDSQGPAEKKASAVAPVVAYGAGARVAWSARDTVSLTKAGYVSNPVAHRCVKLVSEAAAALPLILEGARGNFDQHPAKDLLTKPNPTQGRAEFLEALYSQLLLSGDAFIEAVSGSALPGELYILRSDRMRVLPGQDGWPAGYEYRVGAQKHRFDAQSPVICHIRNFHPQDDHYGYSPLQAAAMAIDVHSAASRWSKALLDNAARPSGAIVYRSADGQGSLTSDQYDRLVNEMEMHHQGARNAGRPMLLEGGLDWKPMGFSPSDMEFQKSKEAAAREIALAFGVPPMLLGIPGDATYANYQEAHRAFFRLTVLPLAHRIVGRLSDWLSEWGGDRILFRPDLDQVAALSPERDAQWKRVLSADFLTNAEKRKLLGLPKEPADG